MEQGIFRLDRNLTNNINYLKLAFGDDTYLVISILCYIAWKHNNMLFHVGVFDTVEFAKLCKFERGFLRRRHPAPAQLERLSENDKIKLYKMQEQDPVMYRVFDSLLENALYLLYTRAIAYPSTHIIYALNMSEIQKIKIDKITFFKRLQIVFQKSKKGKKKIYYEYELDESCVHNLSQYYLVCNLDVFAQLRKKGLDSLYLYIKNLREYYIYRGKKSDSVNFNSLCEVAKLNRSNVRMRKQDLIHAFAKLSTLADFEVILTFLPLTETGQLYVPVVTFPALTCRLEEDVILEKQNILFLNFSRLLCESFKEKHDYYMYKDELLINILIQSIRENSREKVLEIYLLAQVLTFKKLSSRSKEKFDEFYCRLLRVKTLEEIKELFATNIILTKQFLDRKFDFVGEVTEEYTMKLGWERNLNEYAQKHGYLIYQIGSKIYLCK